MGAVAFNIHLLVVRAVSTEWMTLPLLALAP